MLVKIDEIDIETNDITKLEIYNIGEIKITAVIEVKTGARFSFSQRLKDLDIDKEILGDERELNKYIDEFKTRLFRNLIELLFSDDPFSRANDFTLQERAGFINEMIHNAL